MATRTKADLVVKILEKLFVVPEGQAPETEDTARVALNLQSVLDSLRGREIVYVPDPDAIPGEWFMDLAKVCAWELKDEFGLIGEQLQKADRANSEGIRNLKIMTRGRPTYEPLRTLSY